MNSGKQRPAARVVLLLSFLLFQMDRAQATVFQFPPPFSCKDEGFSGTASAEDLKYVGGIENARLFIAARANPDRYRLSFLAGREENSRIGIVTQVLADPEGFLTVHYDDQVYEQPRSRDTRLGDLRIRDVHLLPVNEDPKPGDFKTHGHADLFLTARDHPDQYRISFLPTDESQRIVGQVMKVFEVQGRLEVHLDGGRVFRQRYYMNDVKLLGVRSNPSAGDFKWPTQAEDVLKALRENQRYRILIGPHTGGEIIGKAVQVQAVDGFFEIHFENGPMFRQASYLPKVKLLDCVPHASAADLKIGDSERFVEARDHPDLYDISFLPTGSNTPMTGTVAEVNAVDGGAEIHFTDGRVYLQRFYLYGVKLLPKK